MDRANRSISTLNSVMIEYINGMKLIKAYNMGSKSFQKFSSAIHEETPCGMRRPGGWGRPMRLCGHHRVRHAADGAPGRDVFPERLPNGQRLSAVPLRGFLYLTEIRPLQGRWGRTSPMCWAPSPRQRRSWTSLSIRRERLPRKPRH